MIVLDGRYITDHYPGIGRYTYNLVDTLARVAPAARFVLLHNPALKNTRYDIAALARYRNVELRRVDAATRSLREQWAIPRALGIGRGNPGWLPNARATTQGRPYVYHTPYYIKPYFLGVPSIVTIFDLIPLRVPRAVSASARILFRVAMALAVRTSARVIVPSAATRDDLVTILGVAREKIAVIPLAADARFTPQARAETARVREKYGLPARYALYVGINKPHKNLQTLMDAWGAARVHDAALVIAGAWDARYSDTATRGRDDAAMRFIANIPDNDLPALYSGAIVFVMPSLYEGFGLPLLEAMACGAPVISSDASSLPEVGGDAAFYFNPRDPDALAAMLARVLSDAALHDELRGKSLARAAEFSWERTAGATIEVYKEASRQGNK